VSRRRLRDSWASQVVTIATHNASKAVSAANQPQAATERTPVPTRAAADTVPEGGTGHMARGAGGDKAGAETSVGEEGGNAEAAAGGRGAGGTREHTQEAAMQDEKAREITWGAVHMDGERAALKQVGAEARGGKERLASVPRRVEERRGVERRREGGRRGDERGGDAARKVGEGAEGGSAHRGGIGRDFDREGENRHGALGAAPPAP